MYIRTFEHMYDMCNYSSNAAVYYLLLYVLVFYKRATPIRYRQHRHPPRLSLSRLPVLA